jgi:hypothetical protein
MNQNKDKAPKQENKEKEDRLIPRDQVSKHMVDPGGATVVLPDEPIHSSALDLINSFLSMSKQNK